MPSITFYVASLLSHLNAIRHFPDHTPSDERNAIVEELDRIFRRGIPDV